MVKRSWSEANAGPGSAPSNHAQAYENSPTDSNPRIKDATSPTMSEHRRESMVSASGRNGARDAQGDDQNDLPGITRKIKACAACRKQKVW